MVERRGLRIGCAVLAAGAGSRFGDPGDKLLAPLDGKPLLSHAIDAACGSAATSCALILGAAAVRVSASVDARRCATYVNDRWRDGLSSTIACAVDALEGCDALILMLADQPRVTSVDLNGLIAAYGENPRRIVALREGRIWGAPVLFPQADFAALRKLQGDAGAKRYAQTRLARVSFVRAKRDDAFEDVDAATDLRRRAARKNP